MLLPRFQHVRDNGAQLTRWLNDFFSPAGGGGPRSTVEEVTKYVDWFLDSDIDGALIHEAAFLYETAAPEAMWQQIAMLTCSGDHPTVA